MFRSRSEQSVINAMVESPNASGSSKHSWESGECRSDERSRDSTSPQQFRLPSVEVTMGHADFVEELWGLQSVLPTNSRNGSGHGSGRGGNGPGGSGRHEMAAIKALKAAAAQNSSGRTSKENTKRNEEKEKEKKGRPSLDHPVYGPGHVPLPHPALDSERAQIGGAGCSSESPETIVFPVNATSLQALDNELQLSATQPTSRRKVSVDLSVDIAMMGTMSGSETNIEEEDAVGEMVESSLGTSGSRRPQPQMSFVGFFRDDNGVALSKERIFSSSGESHGVSRSIGDRSAARGCIAKPDVKTVVVPHGSSARIVVCSDGVWDVASSVKAVKAIKGYGVVETAAKKLCAFARQRREYGGFSMDDISTIVIDLGVKVQERSPMSGSPRNGGFFSFCMGPPDAE